MNLPSQENAGECNSMHSPAFLYVRFKYMTKI